ncbi:MAG: hypothetical protein LBC60_01955 [Spirochaetaceae bacterium]|nr:hypothetical protein [Spirochaetaceae bacterium]
MIRFIGGLWRVMTGGTVKSFATYASAVAYLSNQRDYEPAWEDSGPLYTTDDIHQQMYK